jgi:hypothetical protein
MTALAGREGSALFCKPMFELFAFHKLAYFQLWD